MDMVFSIVDQSERGDGTGAQSEIAFHALFGGKGEFSLMQAMFEVVDSHLLIAIEHDQIVPIPLVVAEKEVFTMF